MTQTTADDIRLDQTCGACPEQYDAYDPAGKQVGYLRLRHGWFTVDMPDVGGVQVYSAQPDGDGMFTDEERDGYLRAAREKIAETLNAAAGRSGDAVLKMTAQYLIDRHLWDQACEVLGLNPWAVNEGQIDPAEWIGFTEQQARDVGLINASREG